jgi:hypothetical protein
LLSDFESMTMRVQCKEKGNVWAGRRRNGIGGEGWDRVGGGRGRGAGGIYCMGVKHERMHVKYLK